MWILRGRTTTAEGITRTPLGRLSTREPQIVDRTSDPATEVAVTGVVRPRHRVPEVGPGQFRVGAAEVFAEPEGCFLFARVVLVPFEGREPPARVDGLAFVPRFFVILDGRGQDLGVLRLACPEQFEEGAGRGEQLGVGLPGQEVESGRVGPSQPPRGFVEQPTQ